MKKTAKKTSSKKNSSSKVSFKKQSKKTRKLSAQKKAASAPALQASQTAQTTQQAKDVKTSQTTQSVAEKSTATALPKLEAEAMGKAVGSTLPESCSAPTCKGVAEKLRTTPNRAVFFFFLAIFACMLLLESTRFKAYFETESGEYPFLRPVGEYISVVAERTGIQGAMDALGQWTGALSQEYLIVAHESFEKQWQDAMGFYASLLGLDSAQHEQAPQTSPQTPPFEEKIQQGASTVAQKDTPDFAEPVESESHKDRTKEGISDVTPAPAPSSSPTPSSSIPSSPIPGSSVPTECEEPRETVPAAPSGSESYAYYDSGRLVPAPSAAGIEAYLTKLPDYGKKIKVLLIGDSMMMEGLGPTLQKSLRQRTDLEVIREGRYSSGLSKPDFFNWPENLKKLLAKHNPDLLIISLGANDTQDIMVGKRRFRIDTEGWERVYAIRVINFLELATENNRKVLWVSLPVMGRMPYANRTKLINSITADMSAFYPGVVYKNIEHLLTQDGKYTSFIKGKDNETIRLRSKDNIHVSTAGGQILTDYLLPHTAERMGRIRLDEVGDKPYIPVAGKVNIIEFTSNLLQKKVKYNVFLPNIPRNDEESNATATMAANILAVQPQGTDAPPVTSVVDLVHKSLQNIALTQDTRQEKKKPQGFPVLYILHGATGHADDWNTHMGQELQAIANEKKVIVVAPVTEDCGWYMDSPKLAHSQIESFMVKELLPHVDMLFPTNGKRAVAGISMGGHGAITLGFKYPKLFSSVASMSGVLDIRRYPERWKLAQLLGAYEQNKALWDKHAVLHVMEKSKISAAPKQFIMVTGLQDVLVLEDHKKAQALLEKRKISFEYEEREGGHQWDFWVRESPKILRKQADFLNL